MRVLLTNRALILTFGFVLVVWAVCVSVSLPAYAELKRDPAPEGASVYFISPKDGEVVGEEFTVRFGLKGMGVAPAGTENPHTGHHHILIDVSEMPDLSKPLPANDNVRHFGGGQTETTLKLPKGKHTLQLLVGNYLHVPHDPPVMSDKITITVR